MNAKIGVSRQISLRHWFAPLAPVCRRGLGAWSWQRGLCARCLYHRPAPIRLSVGTGSLNQICCQAPGPAWIVAMWTSSACSRYTEQGISSSSAPSPIPNTGIATLIPGTNSVVFDAIRPLHWAELY